MHRGIEIGIFLQPKLRDEGSVAHALGNLAAWRLQKDRNETLEWQVLRIRTSKQQHHYRLVIRHPARVLDLGIRKELSEILQRLSEEGHDQLLRELRDAEREGLKPVPLRPVTETVDFWQDNFWEAIGGPAGFGPMPPGQ